MKKDKNLSLTVKIMTPKNPPGNPFLFADQDSPVLHLSVTKPYFFISLRKKSPWVIQKSAKLLFFSLSDEWTVPKALLAGARVLTRSTGFLEMSFLKFIN